MLVKTRGFRGLGQSGEVPVENIPTPVGPPGSVVIVDAGGGQRVAAQLDAAGQVKSMWQVADGAGSGAFDFGGLVQKYGLWLAIGGLGLLLLGGRR
jgi:hypothetical protein